MRITYAAAISLDGFIAKEDGDVSWLDDLNIDMSETGLDEFFASIDGLVMGRRTYDFVFNYGAWPYEDKPSWVCTSQDVQRMEGANLRVARGIDEVIASASSSGLEHLWLLGGGRLASSFLDRGLITNLSLSEMPIELGAGIPLFAEHSLEDIGIRAREIVQKTGFRQMEIVIEK